MTIAQTFPSIKPTSRTFSPGTYPSTNFESLDGTKTHIRYGNKRVNATLNLGFSNITDGQVGLILKNFDDVMATYNFVRFNDNNATAGITDPGSGHLLKKEIAREDDSGLTEQGLRWRYSSPPTITSVFPGISNVNCSFVACLDS